MNNQNEKIKLKKINKLFNDIFSIIFFSCFQKVKECKLYRNFKRSKIICVFMQIGVEERNFVFKQTGNVFLKINFKVKIKIF